MLIPFCVSCAMTKAELRKIYREKRTLLTSKDRNVMDDLLLIQFQKFSLDQVGVLLSYSPSETHAEPNTFLFSSYLQHMLPGLQTCYPVTDMSNLSMQAMLVQDDTEFHLTKYGVEEPVNGQPVDPKDIDLVFVPMLICDKAGYRVGFGKGFYDRFLPLCRPDVLKIGFSYFPPVDRIEDTHQFDVPLNFCVTPQEVFEMS